MGIQTHNFATSGFEVTTRPPGQPIAQCTTKCRHAADILVFMLKTETKARDELVSCALGCRLETSLFSSLSRLAKLAFKPKTNRGKETATNHQPSLLFRYFPTQQQRYLHV